MIEINNQSWRYRGKRSRNLIKQDHIEEKQENYGGDEEEKKKEIKVDALIPCRSQKVLTLSKHHSFCGHFYNNM